MNMPASRFFSLINSARNYKQKQRAIEAVIQCDVASIALGNAKYYDDMRKRFLNEATGFKEVKKVYDPTDEVTVAMVTAIFDQAAGLQ